MATLTLKFIPKSLQTKQVVSKMKNPTFAKKLPIRRSPKIFKKQDFCFMYENYPHLFNKDKPIPLKKGIIKDFYNVKNPNIKKHQALIYLREFFKYYTCRDEYLQAIMNETWRHDHLGNVCEEITQEHKAYAQAIINDKIKNKKKLKVVN